MRIRFLLPGAALLALAGLARAEVVVIANPALGVSRLPQNEVTRLFFGQSDQLADGRAAVPLNVEGPVQDQFVQQILKKSPQQVEKYWARMVFTGKASPPREVKSGEVKSVVAGTPGAISYLERSQVDSSVRVVEVTGN
jgi:ABC-type phosphate transport system substrate-binding protein